MQDTILIVDDEATVRQTVREWLAQAQLDCDILTASDAESALKIANQQPIDLAILDWNLGSGDDGLQLLQDLAAFHPDIVAIMITGFANMATLDAMHGCATISTEPRFPARFADEIGAKTARRHSAAKRAAPTSRRWSRVSQRR